MMSIIFQSISAILNFLYNFIGDWGITIVITTVIIKLVLLPVSLKQKNSIVKQQEMSKKIEELKSRYKNDKQKLDREISKLSTEGMKNMFGCLLTFIQLPVMYTLYRVFSNIPVEVGSVIVPWVANLKLPDTYYIIPVISVLIQLMPNILSAIGVFKNLYIPKATKGQVILTICISAFFLAKAPVTLGIYWIASGLFSFFEQIIFALTRKKAEA